MTNHTLPDIGPALPAEVKALAPIGGKRRPLKLVEHPAFRPYRARLVGDALTVIRVPVVSLNGAPAAPAWMCGAPAPTLSTTSVEAA